LNPVVFMLANVNTPGYARETVALQTGVTAGRVNGVVVGEPGRVADKFLEATVYGRSGDAGRAEVEAGYLDRLQSLLGATGSESALPARLDAIAATATAMAGANGGSAVTAPFVGMVEDAIGSMRQLGRDVDVLRGDIEGEVGDTVGGSTRCCARSTRSTIRSRGCRGWGAARRDPPTAARQRSRSSAR
jgi:flagellar hook-associated protein 1 FlgK